MRRGTRGSETYFSSALCSTFAVVQERLWGGRSARVLIAYSGAVVLGSSPSSAFSSGLGTAVRLPQDPPLSHRTPAFSACTSSPPAPALDRPALPSSLCLVAPSAHEHKQPRFARKPAQSGRKQGFKTPHPTPLHSPPPQRSRSGRDRRTARPKATSHGDPTIPRPWYHASLPPTCGIAYWPDSGCSSLNVQRSYGFPTRVLLQSWHHG